MHTNERIIQDKFKLTSTKFQRAVYTLIFFCAIVDFFFSKFNAKDEESICIYEE